MNDCLAARRPWRLFFPGGCRVMPLPFPWVEILHLFDNPDRAPVLA